MRYQAPWSSGARSSDEFNEVHVWNSFWSARHPRQSQKPFRVKHLSRRLGTSVTGIVKDLTRDQRNEAVAHVSVRPRSNGSCPSCGSRALDNWPLQRSCTKHINPGMESSQCGVCGVRGGRGVRATTHLLPGHVHEQEHDEVCSQVLPTLIHTPWRPRFQSRACPIAGALRHFCLLARTLGSAGQHCWNNRPSGVLHAMASMADRRLGVWQPICCALLACQSGQMLGHVEFI